MCIVCIEFKKKRNGNRIHRRVYIVSIGDRNDEQF